MPGYKAIPLIWPIFIGQNHWLYKWEGLYLPSSFSGRHFIPTLVFRVGAGDVFERALSVTSSCTVRTLVFRVVGAADVVERALFAAAAAVTTPNKSENDLNGSVLTLGFSDTHCTG